MMSVSHSQLAHNWIHNNKGYETGSSMFYEGDKIFSYGHHYCIAQKAGNVILMNRNKYSSTTSKHCGLVRRAIPYHLAVVYVNNPLERVTVEDLQYNINRLYELLGKAKRARLHTEHYLRVAYKVQAQLNYMATYIKEYRGTDEFKAIEDEYNAAANLDIHEDLTKLQEVIEQRKREEVQKHQSLIEQWHNGEINSLPDSLEFHFLRLHPRNEGYLQTSLNVTMRLETFRRSYMLWKNKRLGVNDRVEQYLITKNTKEIVEIGCHRFSVEELDRFAKVLNWEVQGAN